MNWIILNPVENMENKAVKNKLQIYSNYQKVFISFATYFNWEVRRELTHSSTYSYTHNSPTIQSVLQLFTCEVVYNHETVSVVRLLSGRNR